MKRIVSLVALTFLSFAAVAQTKGDKYVGIGLGCSLQSNGNSDNSNTSIQLAGQTELAFFPSDCFRLAVAFGTNYLSGIKSNQTSLGFYLNPALSYYFKMSEGIYYTPELGAIFEKGNITNTSPSLGNVYPYNGFGAYLDILSFEFRISDDMALGMNMGVMSFAYVAELVQLSLNLNSGSLVLRYYL